MQLFKLSRLILVLLASIVLVSPVWAKKSLPAINDEGMELVKDSKLATVYADPGADLAVYQRIWLEDASVAFKKNWQRDQNRGNPMKVRSQDMQKIMDDVAALFREVFTAELLDGGYQMAEEPAADVLIVRPAIVDLNIHAPDIRSASMTRTYSESAGEMTLNLELFDSLTGDKIAKATDRKRDYDRGYMEWRTRVNNRADAKRMMKPWAKALRSALDEAKTSTQRAD